MSKEVRLWRVDEDHLVEIHHGHLDLEARLEKWLVDDVALLDEGLLVIAHQVTTAFGGEIDLLCLDEAGDLVIVELKRNRTPREITAQVLDYASWVVGLSNEEIHRIAAEGRLINDLETAFSEKFRSDLPETLNADHRMLVVGSEVDPSTERIIAYLSSRYGVNINAASFDYFKTVDGLELVARVFLLDPALVKVNVRQGGSTKRGRSLTIDELGALAAVAGPRVHALYEHAMSALMSTTLHRYPTQTALGFSTTIDGGHRSIISLFPGKSETGKGLFYRLYTNRLALLLGLTPDEVARVVPRDSEPWEFVKGNPDFAGAQGYITSTHEIDVLADAIRQATSLG